MPATRHQYIRRDDGQLCDERLYQDPWIRLLYGRVRESAPLVFRALVSRRMTGWLGYLNYDLPLGAKLVGNRRFLRELNVDLSECLDPPAALHTARRVFERKIRYWQCRPMSDDPRDVASPADARVLVGSFEDASLVAVKEKFFRFEELLGGTGSPWLKRFAGGDYAIFRLTPDKYHYNHVPVDGRVVDLYEIDGAFHSCNPGAVVTVATPYSKNKRVVTIIDTDVAGGTGIGLVAMIEIVALMIGEVVQCYSERHYDDPQPIGPGMFVQRGQPKSLYRPGSSTDVLVFQAGRVQFADDLLANRHRRAESRFSSGFGRPLVETDLAVRSTIASARGAGTDGNGSKLERD